MSGAIPRSLMTPGELGDLQADEAREREQRELEQLDALGYIPTPAALAYFDIQQHRLPTSVAGHGESAAGESTGGYNPEGWERPEGDAPRPWRPSLLARRPLRDENDTPAARGLAIAFIASAAMWAGALALAADLGAFR